MKIRLLAALLLALAVPASADEAPPTTRPAPTVARPYDGIEIERRVLTRPRPNVMHVVRIDPAKVNFIATGDNGPAPEETTLQTTRAFAEETGALLAFNGSFYRLPGNVEAGERRIPIPFADLVGLAVSDGRTVSEHEQGWPAFAVGEDGRATMFVNGPTPRDAPPPLRVAVAGRPLLVRDGRSAVEPPRPGRRPALHPRTFIGGRPDGTVVLVVVDGRQPGTSEGLTNDEMADVLLGEGAAWGLNLDGGGSTTLVLADPQTGTPRLLNTPVGANNRPGTERPTGFNLGLLPRAAREADPPP